MEALAAAPPAIAPHEAAAREERVRAVEEQTAQVVAQTREARKRARLSTMAASYAASRWPGHG